MACSCSQSLICRGFNNYPNIYCDAKTPSPTFHPSSEPTSTQAPSPIPTLSPSVSSSPTATPLNFQLTLNTDYYSAETSWVVRDRTKNCETLGQGGQGSEYQGFTLHNASLAFTPDSCYLFTIYDSYGDGICCYSGNGNFTVVYGGEVVGSGGEFASQESVQFGSCESFSSSIASESLSCEPKKAVKYSTTINSVTCSFEDVISFDGCITSYPHFDPEGAVCAYDHTILESYCSYDVGKASCARCKRFIATDVDTASSHADTCKKSFGESYRILDWKRDILHLCEADIDIMKALVAFHTFDLIINKVK